MNRRSFLSLTTLLTGHLLVRNTAAAPDKNAASFPEIGVHPYSLQPLFDSGSLTLENHLPFVREKCNLPFVEYATEMSEPLLHKPERVESIRRNARTTGIRIHAMLCTTKNSLDAPEAGRRDASLPEHLPWASVARKLGANFIRVRAGSGKDPDAALQHAAEGIGALCMS